MQRADQNNAEIHAKVEYLSGKRLKVRLKVRIYLTLTLTYALIRGVRSETAEV